MSTQKISIPRPPENITPIGFWEEWLPKVLTDFFEIIKANAGELDVTLAVRVTGDGGGDWSVVVKDGGVDIRKELLHDATLTLVISENDFLDAVVGKRDDLIPGQNALSGELEPAMIGETIRRAVGVLSKVRGTLLFRAEHRDDPFQCLLKFQGELKDRPDTTVIIEQDDLRDMRLSGTGMVSAFMAGKIKIEGLMELIMNFMPLLS